MMSLRFVGKCGNGLQMVADIIVLLEWDCCCCCYMSRRTCHSFQWLETPSKCQSEPFSRKCSFMKSTCLWFWAHCTMLGHRCAGSIVLGSTGDAWGNEVLKLQEVWNLAFHCIPCKLGWAKLSKWLKDVKRFDGPSDCLEVSVYLESCTSLSRSGTC